ncbi:hypothetical protein AGIG_G13542 [Arapaima gigas]
MFHCAAASTVNTQLTKQHICPTNAERNPNTRLLAVTQLSVTDWLSLPVLFYKHKEKGTTSFPKEKGDKYNGYEMKLP